VQIDFDPGIISYGSLLDIFWDNHEPSVRSWSRQYMSAVFCHDGQQHNLAAQRKELEAIKLNSRVYTEIIPYSEFYLAEDYHQKYALQHNQEIMNEFKSIYPAFERIVSSTAAARINGYLGGFGDRKTLEGEISSYGLSPESQTQILASVRSSTRFHCVR